MLQGVTSLKTVLPKVYSTYLGVDTKVSLQGWTLCKLATTERANKWLHTCVSSKMGHKGTMLCKEGTTLLAFAVLFTCM
jgi:hypothetical protein